MLRNELGSNTTAIVNRLASELQNTDSYPSFLADVKVIKILFKTKVLLRQKYIKKGIFFK